MKEVEHNLAIMYEQNIVCVFTKEEMEILKNLENSKQKLLERREANWRIKSIVVWLEKGDENIIFFHNYTNHRKRINKYGR
jgi:hypothetical protein